MVQQEEREERTGKCPTCGMEVTYTGDPPETCPHCKVTLIRWVRIPGAGGFVMRRVRHHVFLRHGKYI